MKKRTRRKMTRRTISGSSDLGVACEGSSSWGFSGEPLGVGQPSWIWCVSGCDVHSGGSAAVGSPG